MDSASQPQETFQSLFCPAQGGMHLQVPDYQRAYSWEPDQVDLFIADLGKYSEHGRKYYFGHFIVETPAGEGDGAKPQSGASLPSWQIVDGQQRLTTLVLFLRVCQILADEEKWVLDPEMQNAFSLIRRFSTVSYDAQAFQSILGDHLVSFFADRDVAGKSRQLADEEICSKLGLDKAKFTHSQKRMVLALRRFYQAFEKGLRSKKPGLEDLQLIRARIPDYIRMMLQAHCSCHRTSDKAVAVHIFEMHNTRGVPLTPLEVLKAKLMKFVYDKSPARWRDENVEKIQQSFGSIYAMEESLATGSFRGQMQVQQLLKLHLQMVDDGRKALIPADDAERSRREQEFCHPADNAEPEALIAYVESNLLHEHQGSKKGAEKAPEQGVEYALKLAQELEKSVRIVSQDLPAWDKKEPLVGDVLILERRLSCQLFLLACRRQSIDVLAAAGGQGQKLLQLWERLLFTRDFHGVYHGKHNRDNFPLFFAKLGQDLAAMIAVLERYLQNGFRHDTHGLQRIVATHLGEHKDRVLKDAYDWWLGKMKYVLYKHELSLAGQAAQPDAHIRKVMKGTISVEHILPRNWQAVKADSEPELALKRIPPEEQKVFIDEIDRWINGIGNLLLLTPGENSSESDKHPADKEYAGHHAGSYEVHRARRTEWLDPLRWTQLIEDRGKTIYTFMFEYFKLEAPQAESTQPAQ